MAQKCVFLRLIVMKKRCSLGKNTSICFVQSAFNMPVVVVAVVYYCTGMGIVCWSSFCLLISTVSISNTRVSLGPIAGLPSSP